MGIFLAAKAESLLIQGDNAGTAGLHHADGNAGAEPHFIQAADEMGIPVDIVNASGFAGPKQMQRNDERHGA